MTAELEYAILGSMIRDKACLSIGIELMGSSNLFRLPFTHDVYGAISDMSALNKPIDAITLKNFLKSKGNWVDAWESDNGCWVQMLSYESDINTFENHLHIFIEEGKKDSIKRILSNADHVIKSGEKSANEIIVEVENMFNQILQEDKGMNIITATQVLKSVKQDIIDIMNGVEPYMGISNGFENEDFDKMLSYGIGELIILAGRPGMGKTTFLIQLLCHLLKRNIPTGLISLEMTKKEIFHKILANFTDIDSYQIKKGGYDMPTKQKIIEATELYADLPLYMNDNFDIDYYSLRAKILYLVKVYDCKVVFIDHMGLINISKLKKKQNLNDTNALGETSRMLKILANELKITIVLVSQLSRAVEQRPDKRPMLSDLRDSGRLEEDANRVIFLYRDEYYNDDPKDSLGRSLEGVTEVIVAKNRGNKIGSTFFDHDLPYSRYSINLEHTYNTAKPKKQKFERV